MKQGVQKAFQKVRDELDDHLDSINRNSAEVQGLYEYLMTLEKKMDKLNERVEDLHFDVEKERAPIFSVAKLSFREQEVFLAIYASDTPVNVVSIASSLGFTVSTANKYVENLLSKGVPILRQAHKEGVFVSLELRFKEMQAKNNIVNIDERISQQLTSEKTI